MNNEQNEKNLPEQETVQEEGNEAVKETVTEEVTETADAAVTETEVTEEPAEADPEEKPDSQPEKTKKPQKEKTGKFKRGGMATLMSVVFVAIVVVINILVGLLTERFPSMNIDLTAQKLNSLSDQALEIAKSVDKETTLYLIGSEEKYRKDQIFSSYGLEFSQVANLAEKLQEANSKISVEFIDPDSNPGFISQYSSESLTTGCVMVATETRHKTLQASDLFTVGTDQTTYQTVTYSKVDSALAAALEMVNMDNVPVLTIATGHDEKLDPSEYLSAFIDMMENQNYEVKEIDFATEEIPEDTQILMLPTPSTDYSVEEIEKLRAYLDDEERPEDFMLLVTCHTTQGELPRLASLLEEWGIRVESGMVAETDTNRMMVGNQGYVMVDANQEDFLEDESYSRLICPGSRPITRLFEGNGDVSTYPVWTTADSAFVVTADMEEIPDNPVTEELNTAVMAVKHVEMDNDYKLRSIVVFGSSIVFLDDFINTTAYDNGAYIEDLLQYCTGTDDSQVTVKTEQVQTNILDISTTLNTVLVLGLGVFTIGIPVVIVIIGLVVYLKRRHL